MNPFHRKQATPELDRDLADELQAHLNLAAQDHVDRGESVSDAKAHARRDLGNELMIKEVTRANWAWISLEQIGKDLRYAARQIKRSPGFAVTVILTLALGIGANTAIFGIVNQVLFHPAGIDHPERVVAIRERYEKLNLRNITTSAPAFKDALDSRKIFEHAAAAESMDFNYSDGSKVERLEGAAVSSEWFAAFGAKTLLGRVFTAEEDQPNVGRVAVLSYDGWTRLFGADRAVLGRTIELNRLPYQVIGVIQQGFEWPNPADVWIPIAFPQQAFSPDNRFNESYFTVARMRPGVTVAQADQWMKGLSERALESGAKGASEVRSLGWSMLAMPFLELTYGDVKTPMLMLLGAVLLVLLIASSNVAGLVLARYSARSQEIAVQTALGASRWRLFSRICADTLVLTVLGGVAGIGVAFAGMNLLLRFTPPEVIPRMGASVDLTVLCFTGGAVVIAALLCGILPAWHASAAAPHEALRNGGRSSTGGRQRLRSGLVIGEAALALLLLVTAGAFFRSFKALENVDPGFQPKGVMTATFSMPKSQFPTVETQASFYRRVLERLGPNSGAKSAAIALGIPFSRAQSSGAFRLEGETDLIAAGRHADMRWVTAGFFQALGIPLKEGSWFEPSDLPGQSRIVIDEALARQAFPGQSPIGKKLQRADGGPWFQIIGVVGHTMQADLAVDSGKGMLYFDITSEGRGIPFASVLAKTDGDPAALASIIRAAVHEADPNQPVYSVQTMEQMIAGTLGARRLVMQMMSFFALIALVLAALGLYGVIHYGVTQRTREIGLRVALGAAKSSVLQLIVGQGLRLAGIGVALGLLAASGIRGILEGQLFHVSAFDPAIIFIATITLLLVALLASYFPARRAASVDPAIALRSE